jgi:hypothetical protein
MKIPPVNDFPLERFQLPGQWPETTLLIVGIAALIQDIAVLHSVCQYNYCGACGFSKGHWEISE